MKKRLLSLALGIIVMLSVFPVAVNAADGIQINNENFPDDVFRNYVSKTVDTDGNQFLSTAEIAAMEDMEIGKTSVADLKGIEFFTSLKRLTCDYNNLNRIDLSANKELDYLYCRDNKITSLNVKNTKITFLDCSNNLLSSLDVTNNSTLQDLNCSGNQLANLDVSKNLNLGFLGCSINDLKTLDVSQNSKLAGLGVSFNELTSLDLSKNELLKSVYCEENLLTALDVSNNPELESLNCNNNKLSSLDVTKNPMLKYLQCAENLITNLDVSKNTQLLELRVYDNQLSNLDITQNQLIKELSCQENKLSSLNVKYATNLQQLFCNNNQLKALDLSTNVKLEDLRMSYNQVSELDLSNNTRLSVFSARANCLAKLDFNIPTPMGEWDIQYVYKEMKKTKTGWELNIGELVGKENISWVALDYMQDYAEWVYDEKTGIARYTGVIQPAEVVYRYRYNMTVTVILKSPEDFVVMKEGAEQAVVNGILAPTTKYDTGYAKMESINGTMQMPLRYIGEVSKFQVYYNANTGKTRVASPSGVDALTITQNSAWVTKESMGYESGSSQAPLPFTIQKGVTMGPLRYTCEAMGLSVYYKETAHGNYVVVSPVAKTPEEALEKIEEAYQLGL